MSVGIHVVFLIALLFFSQAHAQTQLYPPPPNQEARQLVPQQLPVAEIESTIPAQDTEPSGGLPEASGAQARQQRAGDFPAMIRREAGGQLQEAWNESEPVEGTVRFGYCDLCTYKVRLREFMVTTILLPDFEEIVEADVGDGGAFRVRARSTNSIAIKPLVIGVDSNLNIYTKSGRVYPFYLRAEGHRSRHIPDLLVRIEGDAPKDFAPVELQQPTLPAIDPDETFQADEEATLPPLTAKAVAGLAPDPDYIPGDIVQEVAFDPDKLRGFREYKLRGGADSAWLKPEVVFRDDHFTYLQYNKDAWTDIELPTAYVVVDGIDELVNSRVQGRTFIIESTRKLIALKSGSSWLCIEYQGAGV